MATSDHMSRRRRKAVADSVSGVAASLVALWTFYPLDVIKINLQANKPFSDIGLVDLYRGVGTKTLHGASSSFVYFYVYSWITSWWAQRTHDGAKPSTLARLALSAVAAMINTTITLPLDVMSSKQQTSFYIPNQDSSVGKMAKVWREQQQQLATVEENEEETDHFFESSQESIDFEDEKKDDNELIESISSPPISRYNNAKSLWKGLAPSLLLCTNPSIHYTVFDLLKSNLLDGRTKQSLSMAEAFVMGLIAKLTATLATYPLIRAKVLLMVTHQKSLLGTLVREYNRDGVRSLYKGCNMQLAHTILKSALLMMVREQITATTNRVLLQK